jgi:protease I
VLASAGLLGGRTLTSWPGVRDDMVNAGAIWLDQEVVRDGNLVTSRGPQDLVPFVRAVTVLFAESAPIPESEIRCTTSSPQASEPPAIVLSAMKWLPRPSLRTAIGLGAFAMAAMAAGRAGAPRAAAHP